MPSSTRPKYEGRLHERYQAACCQALEERPGRHDLLGKPDACLGEGDIQMLARCIRLDLDCADICEAIGKILSRQTAFEPQMVRGALQACAKACRLCGDECDNHAQRGMEHCRICAAACRRCESACNNFLSLIVA